MYFACQIIYVFFRFLYYNKSVNLPSLLRVKQWFFHGSLVQSFIVEMTLIASSRFMG